MVLTEWAAGLAQAQSERKGRREISSPTEVRTSDHPARSKSLYRISPPPKKKKERKKEKKRKEKKERKKKRVVLTPDVKSVNL